MSNNDYLSLNNNFRHFANHSLNFFLQVKFAINFSSIVHDQTSWRHLGMKKNENINPSLPEDNLMFAQKYDSPLK
jgi:hypothetical protein